MVYLLNTNLSIVVKLHVFSALHRHKKQKEEDISICECKFDFGDPDSACGERCLNVITNTECTPGYCPCGVYCKNQVTWIKAFASMFLTLRAEGDLTVISSVILAGSNKIQKIYLKAW